MGRAMVTPLRIVLVSVALLLLAGVLLVVINFNETGTPTNARCSDRATRQAVLERSTGRTDGRVEIYGSDGERLYQYDLETPAGDRPTLETCTPLSRRQFRRELRYRRLLN